MTILKNTTLPREESVFEPVLVIKRVEHKNEYAATWTSVVDEQPPSDQMLVCFSKDYGVFVTSSQYLEKLKVTHWIAIPPAPQNGE